jgi:trans-2,3-dihydro-3-hydroxyanthranilate isomerase
MTHQHLPFHLVDVFAVKPLTGNPAAVVIGGDTLPVSILQRVAREFNQSETTFLMPPTRPKADWRLRSFTAAGAEVFGVGHYALGAWWWLAHSKTLLLLEGETVFHQQIGDRVLPVTIQQISGEPSNVVVEQEAPRFDRQFDDIAALADALGLAPADVATERGPCQVVYTGVPHLLVPIRDREAVDRIQPKSQALHRLLSSAEGEGCYVFSMDPRQPRASAYTRFFNPTVGIWEDPATATAAGPLGAYLLAHRLVKSGQAIVVEQGTSMGRTSLIQVEVQSSAVRILGRGVVVASGQLLL